MNNGRYRRYKRIVNRSKVSMDCKDCAGLCCRAPFVLVNLESDETSKYPFEVDWKKFGAVKVASNRAVMKNAEDQFLFPSLMTSPGFRRIIYYFGYQRVRPPIYLKKTKDGRCIFLNWSTGRCSIYKDRPKACKSWSCDKGKEKSNYSIIIDHY